MSNDQLGVIQFLAMHLHKSLAALLASLGSSATQPNLNHAAKADLPPTNYGSLTLFGDEAPWNSSTLTWTTVDDRVRGGSSTSHLSIFDKTNNSAKFQGHLDTRTLGGAGFASQSTRPNGTEALQWDLSHYDGIALSLGAGDDKIYTLTLKDTLPESKRSDGRERSSLSWEATFRPSPALLAHNIWLPWDHFKPTFRGKEKKGVEPLKTGSVKQFGLLMRSFFEEQAGDFGLEIRSIAAIRTTANNAQPNEEL